MYRILVTETSVVGVMEMGNIVPRAGIKPTYLEFWTSLLSVTSHRLVDFTTIPTPICLYGSLPERSVQPTTVTNINVINH